MPEDNINSLKLEANTLIAKGKYQDALDKYLEAIGQEKKTRNDNKVLTVLYSNGAQSALKLKVFNQF
jgi:hypothetical protein